MEEERPWADLHPDLVSCIASAREMSLVDYTSVCAVCNRWHSTIPPATPCLIYTATAHDGQAPYNLVLFSTAFSLPAQRRLELRDGLDSALAHGSICVGSGYDWLAVDAQVRSPFRRLDLVNPISGMMIRLPDLTKEAEEIVKKVVFAPNPREANFTAVAIYGRHFTWKVAYVKSGDKNWTDIPQEPRETIVDLVYHDDGKVYGLTMYFGVHVIHIPAGKETQAVRNECLLPEKNGSFPFNPSKVFASPRFTTFKYMHRGNNDKYLVFCEGKMYQVWRNMINVRTAWQFRNRGIEDSELAREIIMLKYDPASWPCWTEVNDLGGYSVFIGKNNALSLQVVGTRWLRPNCVYWIAGHGHQEQQAMVFDLATQITVPCVPDGGLEGFAQWASCWYFLTK